MLYFFLVCLFIFQSLTQEDGDKMTFKCPLLSSRDHTEKDAHLQLNLLPSPVLLWSFFMDAPYTVSEA